MLGLAIRKREPPASKMARICGTVASAKAAKVLMPLLWKSSLILGPIPSITVKSLAFFSAKPAAFAAAISIITLAEGVADLVGAGLAAAVFAGLAAGLAAFETATLGAGISANLLVAFVLAALVLDVLAGAEVGAVSVFE